MHNGQRGFTLIELMIVVAIILILAGGSIPNLLRSKIVANETSAQQTLEVLNNACFAYWTMYGGYPEILANLESTQLIGSDLVSGVRGGYRFTYTTRGMDSKGNFSSYAITAVPLIEEVTGGRSFFTDQTGLVRERSDLTPKP